MKSMPAIATAVSAIAISASRKGSDATKKSLVAGITSACTGYQDACEGLGKASSFLAVSRKGLKGAVELAAASGLFSSEELVKIVKSAAKSAGMSDTSASRALVAVGLRQRAERTDKGSGRKPKPTTEDEIPPSEAKPETVTSESIASAAVAALGKEGALVALARAYHLVKAGA